MSKEIIGWFLFFSVVLNVCLGILLFGFARTESSTESSVDIISDLAEINCELRSEIETIRNRTYQLWFIDEDGNESFVGGPILFSDIFPLDDETGAVMSPTGLVTQKPDNSGVRFFRTRTDIFIYEVDIR